MPTLTDTRLRLFEQLVRMRYFEKRAYDLFMQNLVKGTTHLGTGQEAVAAGVSQAMRDDDYMFVTYRGHNHVLARGTEMTPVMAELLGRQNGLMHGKGGSMHLLDVSKGVLGSYAIIGAQLVIANEPVGVDFAEVPTFFELGKQHIDIRDGQQVMLAARQLKSRDEIALLSTAAAMVDGTYADIAEALRPGVRENEIVALANKRLYEMGSDDVESVNAVSGERCNPHPHNFSDRMIRPGEQAFFDIMHSFNGYRTCYYRTFSVGSSTQAQRDAYARASEWMEAAITAIKPGVSTDKVASVWPKATEFGFPDETSAFGLQFGHGIGCAIHERPIISRVISLDHPTEIKEGMVFALETYCPATDGYSAARIEEEVVVTNSGCRVITLFPAEELPIANRY